MNTNRCNELRTSLEDHRRRIISEMHDGIRDLRAQGMAAPTRSEDGD